MQRGDRAIADRWRTEAAMTTKVRPHLIQSELALEVLIEALRAEVRNCLDQTSVGRSSRSSKP